MYILDSADSLIETTETSIGFPVNFELSAFPPKPLRPPPTTGRGKVRNKSLEFIGSTGTQTNGAHHLSLDQIAKKILEIFQLFRFFFFEEEKYVLADSLSWLTAK